ncbi:hypothetical protein C8F04DRAFT_975524 [Mycena alexandri]|uniref:C3H1-type domain-containing protein n=1 Tax=Mycena alexandri TaxID=1745969 RepID=A0AAD6S2V9_9AGAR|nr:hypothetical protein C8F04DRAFT_975524 [Mycena alexandri]
MSDAFSTDDLQSLSEIVAQYTDEDADRNDIIAALTAGIVSICSLRQIPFNTDHIRPYLEQLDAHDATQRAGGGGSDHGSQHGGIVSSQHGGDHGSQHGSDDEDDATRGRKRSLLDRLSDGEDGESYRAKRSRVNSSAFVWRSRAKQFLDSMVLTQEHQDVLQQVKVYSLDIKESIRDLSNTFHAPALPKSQWEGVLLDHFVDLDSILTSSYAIEAEEPQQLVLGDAHLEVKKSKVVSKVSTHGQWINAFRIYEDAVNFAFEGRHGELRTYWGHINDLFSSRHPSLHARILNYDRAARLFVGQRRDILLSEVHKFRHVQDAHLLDGGVMVAPSSSSGSGGPKTKPPSGPKSRKRTQEICRNFNRGQCRLGAECNYQHACSECHGRGHVAPECPEKARR